MRVLASASFALAKKDSSSEIRLHAFKLLQVRLLAALALIFGGSFFFPYVI